MNAKTIGIEIRAQRARLALSQLEVAELAGIGRRALVELESSTGPRGSSLSTVIAVCNVLGLELSVHTATRRANRDDG